VRDRPDNLLSPLPLVDTMPAVYRGDPFTQQLCAAFDEVLAPVFATLDCFPAYLDPGTTAGDMLDWLGAWIGLAFDGHSDAGRKRELVFAGAAILPWRGTVESIRAAVNAVFDQQVEIVESGAVTWSSTPDAAPGGLQEPTLLVRVTTDAPDEVDVRRLDAVVESVKPAHLPHRVEVVPRDGPDPDQTGSANSA
jgi:phage tail-like protein